MERGDPWACPPLNLFNWNLAWMWQAHAMESAPLTFLMFAGDVKGHATKYPSGLFYQTVKSNR